MRSSFSYSSRCERIEIHSPDAIENAPRRPARATPASITMLLSVVPPATPITSEKFETRPSLMPKTGGPERAADARTVAAFGARDAAARRDALHRGDRSARGRLLLRHRVGGLGFVAVAVGLGRLGAQHQRQHRLGAEVRARKHSTP